MTVLWLSISFYWKTIEQFSCGELYMVFCNNPHFVFLKSPFTPKLNPEKHIVNLANTYETILFEFYKDLG